MIAELVWNVNEDTETMVSPERVAYLDPFNKLGKKNHLKPWYVYNVIRSEDTHHKGYITEQELFDRCEDTPVWTFERYKGIERFWRGEKGYWRERRNKRHWKKRTVQTHLETGDGLLWRWQDGMIIYETPCQVFEKLHGEVRQFNSRLMPEDATHKGYDWWLHCYLQALTGHAEGLPLSRQVITLRCGVSQYKQRKIGFYGSRNVLERPLVKDGDKQDNLIAAKKLYGAWARNDKLRIPIGSSYTEYPSVIPGELDKIDGHVDYYPNSRFYFESEEQAQRSNSRYPRYAVLDRQRVTGVGDGPGYSAEARVWTPGSQSLPFRPITWTSAVSRFNRTSDKRRQCKTR